MMSLKQCCASGSLHTGIPCGRIEKVHGLDCYIADAPTGSSKGIVVIIADAFGWSLPNNRILADCYAKEGNFTVYLPDFMGETHLPEDILISMKALSATGLWNQLAKFGHMLYLMRWVIPFKIWCSPAKVGPRIYDWFRDLRESETDTFIGSAGFCWGGYFVVHQCWNQDENKTKKGQQIVNCGFVAHPSYLTYPQDIKNIAVPFSCAAAGNDPQMPREHAEETERILTSKALESQTKVEHEFVLYSEAHHGFAVRADEGDLKEAEAGEKARQQAITWFSRWSSHHAA